MDFAISERMKETLGRVREIVDDEIIPLESQVMGRHFFAADGAIETARAKVKAAGLWGPQLPTELGGMGLSLLEFGLVGAELGRSPLGHYSFGCQAPDAGNIELLHKYGTDEQKRQYLQPLASGEIRSCFSMTEPQSPGSNPVVLTCTANKDGDDYIIDGDKWFTSSADGAAFAIVMAVTNPDAPKHMRATQIIVPTDTQGFELVRNIQVMGHAGKGYGSHGEVRYNGCRVPQDNRLGPEGAGFLLAQERLGPGRIHHCMRWIGICERSFELMCRRALTRDMGDNKPLAAKQIVRAWIAECRGGHQCGALVGTARGMDHRQRGLLRRSRGDILDQVPGGRGPGPSHRSRHPGPRSPGTHRRCDPFVLLCPRARRAHLRRTGRGPQDGGRATHPWAIREQRRVIELDQSGPKSEPARSSISPVWPPISMNMWDQDPFGSSSSLEDTPI